MTSEAYQPCGIVVGHCLKIKRLLMEDVESSNVSVLSHRQHSQCLLNALLLLVLPPLVALLLRGPPLTTNIASLPLGMICPALIPPTATFIIAPTLTMPMKMS